jgi:glycosyltransferase involved in cell wall biosynthesis
MSNPLVSIVIPTYNRADYLKITLENLGKQVYNNFEIIVVDDGTPGSINEQLCGEFDNVTYYKIKNSGGPAKPRNFGATKAKGKYIAFLDDDDLWRNDKLEIQVAILESNPDFGIIHSSCELIDENGNKLNKLIGVPGDSLFKHGDVKNRMIGNWTLMMPTPLVKKSLLDEVGMFNEEIPPALEDVEFWVRCSFHTKFYYYNEPLALYRKHTNNISNQTERYLVLPLYLKKIIQAKLTDKLITKKEFKKSINSLSIMQLRTIRNNYIITFNNLFILDVFWMFKIRNIKTLIKKIILKK